MDAFLNSRSGNEVIKKYFENPDYWDGLKELDQSNLSHDSNIGLAEKNGKYYIIPYAGGGNNRLMMMQLKYMAEIAKANGDKEKIQSIDEKYNFVGEIRSAI